MPSVVVVDIVHPCRAGVTPRGDAGQHAATEATTPVTRVARLDPPRRHASLPATEGDAQGEGSVDVR